MLWIYREHKLRSVIEFASLNNRTNNGVRKRSAYGSEPPSSKYEILVSVFNPRPDQQKVNWNVRAAIESKRDLIFTIWFNCKPPPLI